MRHRTTLAAVALATLTACGSTPSATSPTNAVRTGGFDESRDDTVFVLALDSSAQLRTVQLEIARSIVALGGSVNILVSSPDTLNDLYQQCESSKTCDLLRSEDVSVFRSDY